MTRDPTSQRRAPTLTDDELSGLIRDAADAWRPPPERLGRPRWQDRGQQNRPAFAVRLGAGLGVAILGTVALALVAPYLGLLRNIGAAPSGSPAAASRSANATPLPRLAIFGDRLAVNRLLIGDYQYEILDLSTGALSGGIGPGAGCDSIGRTSDGAIACTVVARDGAQGAVRVRLALIDTSGRTQRVLTLAEYAPDAFPQAEDAVAARTVIDPGGTLVYVSHVVRHQATWEIGIDAFRLSTGSRQGTLQMAPVPATGGLVDLPGGGTGKFLDPELVAPRLQIAPDGRHLVARADLVEVQGPATSSFWSLSIDGLGSMSNPRSWPPGGSDGLGECLGDDDFGSASTYYLVCGPGAGTSVRRFDLAGNLLGETPIPSELQTYPLASALDRTSGALVLWSAVTRSIARIDLANGALTGPVTAPVASAGGPLGALGAVAGRLSDWLAPTAAAKVYLQPGLVISPDGSRVYALGLARGEPGPLESTGIFVFDTTSLRQVAHWQPTADYVSLALSADGGLLYAAGSSEGSRPATAGQSSVTVFDTATGKVRAIAGQLGASSLYFPPGPLLSVGG